MTHGTPSVLHLRLDRGTVIRTVAATALSVAANGQCAGRLKYTKDHEWIALIGDQGRVGITDYAQQQLGNVVYLELPDVGAKVKQGQSLGTIESVKAVSELYSPVTGEIVQVNAGLKNTPEAVNANPHDSWMVVIKLTNPSEAGALLDAKQYQDLVK